MKAVKILFIILTLCLGIITQTKADGGEAVSGSVAVTSVSGISGMVKDALTGNGIDSADIVITTSTGLTYQTTSYPTGAYFYSMMPSGSFTISITASGYQPVNQLVQAGQGCVFNVFSLVSSDTNYLQLTDQLRIYYENKIINQTGYYTLSGNVNVNGILYFQGEVKVDMRPDLYLHEVSGSEGYFLDDIQGSSVNLLSSSIPYKFYAEDDQLIAKEYMYLAEIPIDMGGFPLTLAGIQIGPTGDSVYLKVIPKLPFPFDKIINIYLEMNDLSVPDIISQISLSVIYSKVNGKGYAGSIEDLEKDFILFKLEGVHVEFDSSLELFGAGFTLSIPGGEEEKSIGSEPIDSLNANLPVIIQDSLGNILTQTNFNNILSNFKAFGLKFLKFGVDVEFIHGAINKLILTLGTKIPIDQTGLFITEIKGGVDNMINENDWRILASVDVETGIDIPPLGSPVKLDDFGVNIHPFSYLKGSGTFEIFDNPVSDGYIEYDSYKKSLSGEGNLDLDDILVGKLFLNLRGGGNLNGGGTLTLKTPSDIPWYLRLIPENKVIAAVETGYSLDKFEVQLPFIPTVPPIPVPIAVKLQFGNPNFPFFHYYLGFNLKDIFLIWKGTKSGKTSIQFQVPENCPKLMVVAGDTLDNQPVDFQLIAPGGRLYDSTWVNYYQFAETHQTMMVIDQPLPGEWTFICSDTANLKMVPMFQNQQPTGLIAQPLKNGSKSNNITLDFTDYSDTLNVKVFYDTDREHFDGSFIQEFQVVNNAHLAFDWQNQDITDGEYFIYCMIDDGKNAPVMQYAPGSIQVQHTGFTEVPQNVVITQPGDSVRIQWDVNAGSDIRFTTVYFKNLSTGRNDEVMVSDTNVAFLKGLKIGQAYEVWCSFVGQQGNTGPASIAQNLTFHGPAGVNNPPYFTNDPHVYWKVIADEASGFTLTAGDADNDALSFSLPQDTLGITVNGNQLEWTPTGDQRGAYNLMVVVSDGTTTDTTHIQVIVYAQEQAGVDVSFSSVNLYENDNKFVRIRNYRSTANSIWVTVTNVNSGSQIDVDCRKVDEFEYIGKFELSFVNKSAIPVANGDSLRLTYEYNGQTYTAMAMYDSLAQPSDKTPPAGIYDLSVISLSFPFRKQGLSGIVARYTPWY
ncbi:MAG: carboxypeptidase-like regulatory domain-containing protein [Bacteroidetes bacterium]|nr:carboxypeptidase-like regulatory domain-containing protein [Bacteroidota bacterium]